MNQKNRKLGSRLTGTRFPCELWCELHWPLCAREARIAQRKRILEGIDHSKVKYAPFQKDFYREVPELAGLTPQEITKIRQKLDGIKIRGRGCPAPIKKFYQCGFDLKLYALYIIPPALIIHSS